MLPKFFGLSRAVGVLGESMRFGAVPDGSMNFNFRHALFVVALVSNVLKTTSLNGRRSMSLDGVIVKSVGRFSCNMRDDSDGLIEHGSGLLSGVLS